MPNFMDRLLPAPRDGGYEQPGHWVWCGSVVRGEDGRYHLFAALWSMARSFYSGYVVSSEIVRASSDTLEGPYAFEEQVLADRGEGFWDGRMTHNPSILYHDGRYLLFYIGGTFPGARPSREALRFASPNVHMQIGVAVSKSVFGPWTRLDEPILRPNPNGWDAQTVTNPAPCVAPDGSLLLYYRSNTPEGLKIGVARAKPGTLVFERLSDQPILTDHPEYSIEDQFVWHNGDGYEMICKDMFGNITGEVWGGAHFLSPDGLTWQPAPDPMAYSRTIDWADGERETLYHFDRPNIYLENGKPKALFAALGRAGASDPGGGHESYNNMSFSKTMMIPLKPERMA